MIFGEILTEANLEETTAKRKNKTSGNVLIASKKIQLYQAITLDLLEGKF